MIPVQFLQDCGEDRAGEVKSIDSKRAQRLERTGYVRVVAAPIDDTPETAMRPRAQARGAKPERRG